MLLCLLGLLLLATGPGGAQDGGDRLVVAQGSELFAATLPRGEFEISTPLEERPDALAYHPDGRLFGATFIVPLITAPPFLAIYELSEQGDVGDVTNVEAFFLDKPYDMSFTSDGRLFVLGPGFGLADPPQPQVILAEIALDIAQVQSFFYVPDGIVTVAPSPRGLWLLSPERLLHFDPATGQTREELSLGSLGAVYGADVDSSGALWILNDPGFIDPPNPAFSRLDPVTGAFRPGPLGAVGPVAIERRCQPSATARCLLGGRFRATASWRDFANRTGMARVATGGSSDSALFYFFEPSNWELLLKVIDGCDENGHFWVFAAGTTDVEYTLEVTDLETGEVLSATNPLGQASPAVTATDAFPGCP